ncbi:MAG: DUF2807 domain-containing protein [Saprospiraceae bacterium]|nr:DUF2807 domain-containing protein [Saprospiraceae bacterium]
MKRIQWLFLAFISVFALTLSPGCFIDFDDDENIFGCINGSGPIVSETITVPAFTGIDLRMSAKVFVRQGDDFEVTVEGKQNIIDELERDVHSGVWRIEIDRCTRDVGELNVFITMPDVTSLKISGSGEIISENTLLVDDIDLDISGSGDMDLALEADDISSRISGSGTLLLQGLADELDLNVSGSGDLRAFDLALRTADINISGSGDVEVFVSELLIVRITGSGDVFFKGDPTLDVTITGSGRVVDAN